MPRQPPGRRWDYVGFLMLLAVVAVLVGGWLAFPRLHREMLWQDCVASGRTNCEVH